MDFSETIVVYDIKVGICSQLNEYMKLYEYQRSRSLIGLGIHHRVLESYQVCSNDTPGLNLTYFTARSNSVPYAFVWEKVKTMDFSETIVVYDIKVGRCSQLDESFMSTKGQGHSLTSVQNTQVQYF